MGHTVLSTPLAQVGTVENVIGDDVVAIGRALRLPVKSNGQHTTWLHPPVWEVEAQQHNLVPKVRAYFAGHRWHVETTWAYLDT